MEEINKIYKNRFLDKSINKRKRYTNICYFFCLYKYNLDKIVYMYGIYIKYSPTTDYQYNYFNDKGYLQTFNKQF